ncbi:MAG: hypothetical protein ISN64_03965 [Rickettsia sp.]|nr:hypothetical protein [Rickettsia sp.]
MILSTYEKNEDTKLSNDLSHNINQEKVKNDSLLESDKTFIFEQKPKINKQNQKIKSEKNISSDKNVQEQSDEKKLKDSQRNNLKNQTSNSLKKDKNKQKIEKSSSNKKDKPKIDVSTNQELSLIENTVLEKDLTLFVKNELQMLQIQDDIVLGKVTDQHIIEMMTLEEYTKKFWTEFEYIQNKPKRDSINNFIKNYYK